MAISRQRHWYRYRSDDTCDYRIQIVDYLAEAAGLEIDETVPPLPPGYEPRFLWLKDAQCTPPKRPTRKRMIFSPREQFGDKFPLGGIVEVAGTKMEITGYVGESQRLPRKKRGADAQV